MSTSQVLWPSAFWALVALAANAMFQTTSDRICGLNAQISTYLHSSPIVCALDALIMLLHFAGYTSELVRKEGFDIRKAMSQSAKMVLDARKDEHDLRETQEGGRWQEASWKIAMAMFAFSIGCLLQFIKLIASRGILATQVWACFYMSAPAIHAMLEVLAKRSSGTRAQAQRTTSRSGISSRVKALDFGLIIFAVLLQLFILTYADLAGITAHKNLRWKWVYHAIRLLGHFAVLLIHIPFVLLEYQGRNPLFNFNPEQRKGIVVFSMLLLNILQATLHGLNLRYSHMYYMWSVIISSVAWMLYYVPITKRAVLGCIEGDNEAYLNVLAFDFFLRIVCFSIFWYIWYYNPVGTTIPNWTRFLGG